MYPSGPAHQGGFSLHRTCGCTIPHCQLQNFKFSNQNNKESNGHIQLAMYPTQFKFQISVPPPTVLFASCLKYSIAPQHHHTSIICFSAKATLYSLSLKLQLLKKKKRKEENEGVHLHSHWAGRYPSWKCLLGALLP